MESINISFSANGQQLTGGGLYCASNTVHYIIADFELGDGWQVFDSVRAVWSNDFKCISTVLGPDGSCTVPHEVLERRGKVSVNLVGSILEDDELTDRLTTYPVLAITVDANAKICGTETAEVTPSQFEQFVQIVKDEVAKVKDIDRAELNADYTLTFYFSDGTETTVGPIRGKQGETGNGIESAVLNDDYTLTLTFTDGTEYTTPPIRGPQGPQGEPGEVTLAELASVLPTDTASGSIASFPDGSDLFDYLSCVVKIEPVQAGSGTPSPDNVRPITGWTGCEVDVIGVNLFDESQLSEQAGWKNIKVYAPVGTVLTASTNTPTGTGLLAYFNASGGGGGASEYVYSGHPVTQTVPSSGYLILSERRSSGSDLFANYHYQIEVGSSASDYHAYNGTTYPVSWQTEAGTVYGGTVDLVTGVLTVDRASVDLGAVDYIMYSSGFSRARFRTTALETLIKKPPNNNTPVEAISSIFDLVNWGTGNSTDVVGVFGVDTDGDLSVWLNASDYSDATAFKTAMSGQTVVYKLATPITYQLDPVQVACLLGQNNVWADCGDIEEVQYKADVQKWVEKQLREINTAILALS